MTSAGTFWKTVPYKIHQNGNFVLRSDFLLQVYIQEIESKTMQFVGGFLRAE